MRKCAWNTTFSIWHPVGASQNRLGLHAIHVTHTTCTTYILTEDCRTVIVTFIGGGHGGEGRVIELRGNGREKARYPCALFTVSQGSVCIDRFTWGAPILQDETVMLGGPPSPINAEKAAPSWQEEVSLPIAAAWAHVLTPSTLPLGTHSSPLSGPVSQTEGSIRMRLSLQTMLRGLHREACAAGREGRRPVLGPLLSSAWLFSIYLFGVLGSCLPRRKGSKGRHLKLKYEQNQHESNFHHDKISFPKKIPVRLDKPAPRAISGLWRSASQQPEECFFRKLLLFLKDGQESVVFLPKTAATSTQRMVLGKLETHIQNK